MRRRTLGLALAIMLVELAGATDVPTTARKLVVVDQLDVAGRAKLLYVVKDRSVTKGAGTGVDEIGVQFHVAYEDGSAVVSGCYIDTGR
jgi:hypothetical protein